MSYFYGHLDSSIFSAVRSKDDDKVVSLYFYEKVLIHVMAAGLKEFLKK
jgi:hypothetical protein